MNSFKIYSMVRDRFFKKAALRCIILVGLLAGFFPARAEFISSGNKQMQTRGTHVVIAGMPTAMDTVEMTQKAGAGQFRDVSVMNMLTLAYDHSTDTFLLAHFTIRLKLKTELWDSLGNPMTVSHDYLDLDVRPGKDTIGFKDKAMRIFNWGYTMKVSIDSIYINGLPALVLPKNIYVESEIVAERYFNFTSASTQTILMFPNRAFDLDCDSTDDEILATWPTVGQAESYDLEWTFVNNYTKNDTGSIPVNQLQYSFRGNSTRISRPNDSTAYRITQAFEKGYVIFRVRAVGRDYKNPSNYIFGVWSEPDAGLVSNAHTNAVYQVVRPHQGKMNWQYAGTFAEDGKRKEVISYFDGSLRNRQKVTKMNSDNNIIIGETIYDNQGRPAVNVLPTPIQTPTCSQPGHGPALHYYYKFNQDDSLHTYSRNDFDTDPLGHCVPGAIGMDSISGSSNYYSGSNPNLIGPQAFLPRAEKYPFTQMEYTQDNTGRVRSQGGVGKTFQLARGHESKFYYGQPNQVQLDRLFGSEAADASHFKKNIVFDANGQASVTYMNQEGKTVATALAGNAPVDSLGRTFLKPLPSATLGPDSTITADLFEKNSSGKSLLNSITPLKDGIEFSTQLLVSYNSTYQFNYNLAIDTVGLACIRNMCLSCVYDLHIKVVNECGVDMVTQDPTHHTPIDTIVGKFTRDSIGHLKFSTTCPPHTSKSDSTFAQQSVKVSLVPGNYTVSKILTLDMAAKNFYLNAALNDTSGATCVKSEYSFIHSALSHLDTSSCYITCASCAAALGNRDSFVSAGKGTAVRYDFLLDQCQEPCRPVTVCSSAYQELLLDVSPQGQYGQYDSVTFNTGNYPLSVFNVQNALPKNRPNSNMGQNWQNPQLVLNGHTYRQYIDDDGNRTKVYLRRDTVPFYFKPQVVDTITQVFLDPNNHQLYTYPENLKNLKDFVPVFRPNFAKSLVVYHPEYAYYQACVTHGLKEQPSPGPLDSLTSDHFDSLLIATQSFGQAVANGFIYPNYASIPNPDNRITPWLQMAATHPWDPFFTDSWFQNNPSMSTPLSFNLATAMAGKMASFITSGSTTLSMVKTAASSSRCGTNYGTGTSAACTDFGMNVSGNTTAQNDSIRNKEWSAMKNFYLSEKYKLQYKRMENYAKFGGEGYNGCFGNSGFDPWSEGLIHPFTFSPPNSPFYDLVQPCGYSTYALYAHKKKRFVRPGETPGVDQSQVAYQVYIQTGQCPIGFELQNFLSAMALSKKLAAPGTEPLTSHPEFSRDLYIAINGDTAPNNFIQYNWRRASKTANKLTANIRNGGTSVCTVILDKTGSGLASFDSIVGIEQLTFRDTVGGLFNFNAVARIRSYASPATPYTFYNITGSSCLNIRDCKFTPECFPNQFSSDLSVLMGTLAASSQLTGSNVDLSTPTTFNTQLTPTILNTLGTGSTNIKWNYPSTGIFELFSSSTPGTKIRISFTGTNNGTAINLAFLNSIGYFTGMKADYNNLFRMNAMNSSGTLLAIIDGKAEKITGSTKAGISMGTCSLPVPATCQETEHQVSRDLQQLLLDILTQKPFVGNGINLYSYADLTDLLKSYLPTSTISTTSTYKADSVGPKLYYDTLMFSIPGGCSLTLYHHDTTGLAVNFGKIIGISPLTGIHTADNSGAYHDFLFVATFKGVPNRMDTVYGTSCFPIKNCVTCPSNPPVHVGRMYSQTLKSLDSIGVANHAMYYDNSLTLYQSYLNSLQTFNTRMGWSSSVKQLKALNYFAFYSGGYKHSLQTYQKFLANFDTLVDNKSMLKIDYFVLKYGNYTNCTQEYQRYVSSVNAYNNRVSSTNRMTPLSDSTFYKHVLCDTVYGYIAYLKAFPHTGPPPKTIQQYFGFTGHTPIQIDSCKSLYQQYISAYAKDSVINAVDSAAPCPQFTHLYPRYGYTAFNGPTNNLCCSNTGLTLFHNYVLSFEQGGSCPGLLPKLSNCQTTKVDTLECDQRFVLYKSYINTFNSSTYAVRHNYHLPLLYSNLGSFLEAGLCVCMADYIRYLSPYLNTKPNESLPKPVDINHFSTCIPIPDSCNNAYTDYLSMVALYNQFAMAHPYSYSQINAVFTQTEFTSKYCACYTKYRATLLGLMDSSSAYASLNVDQKARLLFLPFSCDPIPCTPNNPPGTFVLPPYHKYDNPCVTQLKAVAIMNAKNDYSRYRDSLLTVFADNYTRHCLSALENFTYTYTDKEYHFTLYYYDQAGNLIKTIPPEGVERLAITSFKDPLDTLIRFGRTWHQQLVYTNHRMATIYEYNSLNQLIRQTMPDYDNMNLVDHTLPNGLDSRLQVQSTQFVNSSNQGYLSGYVQMPSGLKRGYLYSTNDAGQNWSRVNGTASSDMNKVQFADSITGYAVGNSGIILKTSDGGNSWDLLNLYQTGSTGYKRALYSLYFTSPVKGVVGGIRDSATTSGIYYTNNGGATFTGASGLALHDTVTGITNDGTNYFATVSNGIGKIYKSATGVSWTLLNKYTANSLLKVQFVNSVLAYAAGADGTLLKSNGTFTQWGLVATGTAHSFRDVFFKNANEGVAIIDSVPGFGQIWKTSNGGKTWTLLSTPGDYYNTLQVYDPILNKITASGTNGLVARVLLTTEPFGIIKLNQTAPTAKMISSGGFVNQNNPLLVSVGRSGAFYYSPNADNIPWAAQNVLSIPSADTGFVKVLVKTTGPGDALDGILLTSSGKLYSFVKPNGSSIFTFSPVTVSPNSGPSPIFVDITMANTNPGTNFYAFDGHNLKNHHVKFTGTTASTSVGAGISFLENTSGITSIAISPNNTRLIVVGQAGTIKSASSGANGSLNYVDYSQNVIPVRLNTVTNVSANNVYSSGDDGSLWQTANGTNWKLLNTGFSSKINDLQINASQLALVACNSGVLYKAHFQTPTTFVVDTLVTTSTTSRLTGIALKINNAYITLASGSALHIPDISIRKIKVQAKLTQTPSAPLLGIAFAGPSNNVVSVGSKASLVQYTGNLSSPVNEVFLPAFKNAHFIAPTEGYALADSLNIRHTSDGGLTWSIVLPNDTNSLNRVWTTKALQAILLGSSKYVGLISGNSKPVKILANGGLNNGIVFRNIDFTNGVSGIIVGTDRAVFSIKPSGSSYVVNFIGRTALASGLTYGLNIVRIFRDNSYMVAGEKGSIYYHPATGAVFYPQQNYPAYAYNYFASNSSNVVFNDIWFHDDRTGYIVGNNGVALKCNMSANIMDPAGLGIVTNGIIWDTLSMTDRFSLYSQTTKSHINLRTIGFTSRYDGFLGGGFDNTASTTGYAILIDDQSGYFSTRFWYDALGRLTISQSSKQYNFIRHAYTYTLYDPLGRIVQIGEKAENSATRPQFSNIFGKYINGLLNLNTIKDSSFSAWIGDTSGNRTEVTQTYYDTAVFSGKGLVQLNLRKHVSSVTYEDVFDGNNNTYQSGSHFSYDIHSNVTTLVQENTNPLIPGGQNLKRIDYDYDLLSGKVNDVHYQNKQPDAFHHHYEYDADNRIIAVYTCKYPNAIWTGAANHPFWDNDASYFYYAHGPLARTEIGDDQVQGMDYAYTLQGYIKGANSNSLEARRDMGKDGYNPGNNTNPHQDFAGDAFGYTLNYFNKDYSASGIVWNNVLNRFEAFGSTVSMFKMNRYDMFSGNISSMVTTICDSANKPMPQGMAYKYDQLNRLIEARAFSDLDTVTNTWGSALPYMGSCMNFFSYDANGNIMTQSLRGLNGVIIDSLSYKYKVDGNGKLLHNRLYHVRNVIANNSGPNEVNDEGPFNGAAQTINAKNNYSYDEIGELRKDSLEQIKEIKWTIYRKLKEITRYPGSAKNNLKIDYDAAGNRIAKHIYTSNNLWLNSTYYVKDLAGNVMSIYSENKSGNSLAYKQIEEDIFGNSRVGLHSDSIELIGVILDTSHFYRSIGKKYFEGCNHLGNVLTTFSDKKIPIISILHPGKIDHYIADISSSTDYYSFGSPIYGRNFDNSKYRYGLNGQEKDMEVQGASGSIYSADFWEFDSRLGRRWNPDPVVKPMESPYSAFANSPIWIFDRNGDDTARIEGITGSLEYLGQLQGAIKAASERVKLIKSVYDKMEDLSNEHLGWTVAFGAFNPLAAIGMQINWETEDPEAIQDKVGHELAVNAMALQSLISEYNLLVGNLKQYLDHSDAVDFGGGVIGTTVAAGVATSEVHKNSKTAKGNFALYEIEINGTHYKYGVANADDVLKRDVTIRSPDGNEHTIPKGTIRRIYVQQRGILKVENSASIRFTVYENVTKAQMLDLETNKIIQEGRSRGWIGDGNVAHESEFLKRLGKFKGGYR